MILLALTMSVLLGLYVLSILVILWFNASAGQQREALEIAEEQAWRHAKPRAIQGYS